MGPRPVRLSAALPLLAAFASAACTRLLGIDEDYALLTDGGVVEPGDATFGNNGARDTGADPNNPVDSVPPPFVDAAPDELDDAAVMDSGVEDPDPPDAVLSFLPCRPGRYEGTFEGFHGPSATFISVPLPVAGTLWMELEMRNATTMFVADGALEGRFDAPGGGPVTGNLSATLVGTIDCVTHGVDVSIVEGDYTLTGIDMLFDGLFKGDVGGTFDVESGTLSGMWFTQEMNPASTGEGSWKATLVAGGSSAGSVR